MIISVSAFLSISLATSDENIALLCSFVAPIIISSAILIYSKNKQKLDHPKNLQFGGITIMFFTSVILSAPLNLFPYYRHHEEFMQVCVGFMILKTIISPSVLLITNQNLLRSLLCRAEMPLDSIDTLKYKQNENEAASVSRLWRERDIDDDIVMNSDEYP